jgi:hypothetical protein
MEIWDLPPVSWLTKPVESGACWAVYVVGNTLTPQILENRISEILL